MSIFAFATIRKRIFLFSSIIVLLLITQLFFAHAEMGKTSPAEKSAKPATKNPVSEIDTNPADSQSADSNAISTPSPRPSAELQIAQKAFLQSYQALKNTGNTDKTDNILARQLTKQNDEIRKQIAELLAEKVLTETDKDTLTEILRTQIGYLQNRQTDMLEEFKQGEKDLTKLSHEENTHAVPLLEEKRMYLIENIDDLRESYLWLSQVSGEPQTNELNKLKENLQNRLTFTLTEIDYNKSQIKKLDSQISQVSATEKTKLEDVRSQLDYQLSLILSRFKRQIVLAEKLEINTTEYKIKIFEESGKVSKDLLSWDVIKSYSFHSLNNGKAWLFKKAPSTIFNWFVAILFIYLGSVLSRRTKSLLNRILSGQSFKMSVLMKDFVVSMLGKIIFIAFFLIGLSQLGINLKPVLAGFGIAGIVIGFALQDTLSNFASGMMLLIYRPFDVGDYIETGSIAGKVSHMSLVNTSIKTLDNQVVIFPNKMIWGNTIKNITHEHVRRVDMVFGISYRCSITLAEQILQEILNDCKMVLKSPESIIRLHTLGDSSVDFVVRPWVKTEDYYETYWFVTREVKLRFDAAGLSIPFPQRDVHLYVEKSATTADAGYTGDDSAKQATIVDWLKSNDGK